MVDGQWTAPPVTKKPSRSDEVLETDQQLEIADRVRTHFESVAPIRPTKPNRSEPDSSPSHADRSHPSAALHGGDIPEFQKFRFLQSQKQISSSVEGGGVSEEEYVETQYYKELDSIDKQHHRTGSGFINVGMVKEGSENGFALLLDAGVKNEFSLFRRSNPATHDWIPNTEEDEFTHESSKPNRSESCC